VFFGDADRLPLVRAGGPGAFDAAGDGVAANAAAGVVDPAQPLFFQPGAFRCVAEVGGVAVAVALFDGVAAGEQRHVFLIVHGHARKGDAYVLGCFDRIGLAVHAFRVDVDQAHHHGGQRVFQVALAGIACAFAAAGGEPFLFGAPVDVFFRVPDVFAAKGE